jgi:hypothetical protein
MRNSGICAAYAITVAAIFGMGATAIGDVRKRAVREDRDLDAAINRIIEQKKEQRAQALAANAAVPAKGSVTAPQTTGFGASQIAVRDPAVLPKPRPAEPVHLEERKKIARAHPNVRHRSRNPHGLHFIPAAFASLPKFTAYTLLGFR